MRVKVKVMFDDHDDDHTIVDRCNRHHLLCLVAEQSVTALVVPFSGCNWAFAFAGRIN